MEHVRKITDACTRLSRPNISWKQWRYYILAYSIGFIVAIYINQFVLAKWDVVTMEPTSVGVMGDPRNEMDLPLIGKAGPHTTFGYGTDSAGHSVTPKVEANYLLHNILDESGVPKLFVKALGRLGNCLFAYVSGYSIAAETNHQLVLADGFKWIEPIFPNLNVTFEEIPKNIPLINQGAYATFRKNLIETVPPHDVLVDGYLQSYKFSVNHTEELKFKLQFSAAILERSRALLDDATKHARALYGESAAITYVGIHIRRGDLVRADKINIGYHVVDEDYLAKSLLYFRLRYQNVIFIVCSDGMDWCKSTIEGDDVWFEEKSAPAEVDLSLLSLCNHTIMSVGTFGWAAGWMAGGEVLYYDPPVNKSRGVGHGFTSADYYLPDWLPINKYNLTYIQRLARTLPKKKATQFLDHTSPKPRTIGIPVPTKPGVIGTRFPVRETSLPSFMRDKNKALPATKPVVDSSPVTSTLTSSTRSPLGVSFTVPSTRSTTVKSEATLKGDSDPDGSGTQHNTQR